MCEGRRRDAEAPADDNEVLSPPESPTGRIVRSRFTPFWLARNAHLQTISPTLFPPTKFAEVQHEHLELPDGDFLELTHAVPRRDAGTPSILIVLHGLEGGWRSPYARALLARGSERRFHTIVAHFRGCGRGPNRLDRSYHSGDTADLREVIRHLTAKYPGRALFAAGFSLGGNVLLKMLGEDAGTSPFKAAVAVSVPFVLGESAQRLEQGASRFYQWWFLRTLRRKLRRKFARHDNPPIKLSALRTARTMREFDDVATAPLHGFDSAEHYYRESSSRQFLGRIERPTLLIQAEDDPLMTANVLPQEDELSSCVTLELSRHGGHVGFRAAPRAGGAMWLSHRILDYLQSADEP